MAAALDLITSERRIRGALVTRHKIALLAVVAIALSSTPGSLSVSRRVAAALRDG